MILLDKVSFGYDRGETLSDLSAEIAPGSFNFLTGPSGAGKSTLMKLLYLRHRPSRGVFELFGEQPSALGPDDVAGLRRRIGAWAGPRSASACRWRARWSHGSRRVRPCGWR